MAIHKFDGTSQDYPVLLVDAATVTVLAETVLETPKAAALLRAIPEGQQLAMFEDLLEQGASTAAAVRANAHVMLLDNKIAELTSTLRRSLEEQLKHAGDHSAEVTDKLLRSHKDELSKLLVPFLDPNAKGSLPTFLVEMLQQAHKDAMNRINTMLMDSEEGALGKAVKQITDQMKETGTAITSAIAAREALRTKSSLRGACFEDMLAERLPILVRSVGRVEHCAQEEGEKAGKGGDYLVVIEDSAFGETVSVAVEAKSQKSRLSPRQIKSQLKMARENRGAAAAILVSDSPDILPDRLGFGQVSDCDFFAAYDPTDTDETSLTCALYMAKTVALATLIGAGGDHIDIAAAQQEVSALRKNLQQFARIEACHSKVESTVGTARAISTDLKFEILTSLRRLDTIFSA